MIVPGPLPERCGSKVPNDVHKADMQDLLANTVTCERCQYSKFAPYAPGPIAASTSCGLCAATLKLQSTAFARCRGITQALDEGQAAKMGLVSTSEVMFSCIDCGLSRKATGAECVSQVPDKTLLTPGVFCKPLRPLTAPCCGRCSKALYIERVRVAPMKVLNVPMWRCSRPDCTQEYQ